MMDACRRRFATPRSSCAKCVRHGSSRGEGESLSASVCRSAAACLPGSTGSMSQETCLCACRRVDLVDSSFRQEPPGSEACGVPGSLVSLCREEYPLCTGEVPLPYTRLLAPGIDPGWAWSRRPSLVRGEGFSYGCSPHSTLPPLRGSPHRRRSVLGTDRRTAGACRPSRGRHQ